MTARGGRDTHGTPVPNGLRCPECPEGVPTLFPSQNGTSRGCPVAVGKGVPCVPVYKTGHRTPGTSGRLGRKAHLVLHHCGQYVLTGLDADRCALVVRVDPYPLSPLGEVAALSMGRPTYSLNRGELEPRDHWNIPGHLPGHDLLVLAAHDCTPMHADWLLPPAPRTTAPAPTTEESF